MKAVVKMPQHIHPLVTFYLKTTKAGSKGITY